MKEGNRNLHSPFYDKVQRLLGETKQSVNMELAETDALEYTEERNYMLELISQKDNVLSNVLTDYIVNDTEGSNAEQVYEDLNQANNDKLRRIKMNDYTSKTYVEYSNILKFIVLLILIMIPILLLAKKGFIDSKLSMTIILVMSFFGFLYILHRLKVLYMKDNKDFGKYRIPFDPTKITGFKKKPSFTNNLGLGLTCVGEACCTDGMKYDNTKNRCLTEAENFENFFDTANNYENENDTIVAGNNLHEMSREYTYIKEPFLSSDADLASLKTRALVESLNNSTANKMF